MTSGANLGPGRRVSRSTGPETEIAASTSPAWSRTGAETDATPGLALGHRVGPAAAAYLGQRPLAVNRRARRQVVLASRRASTCAAEPAAIGSRAPTGTVVRSPLVRSAAATQTRSSPSRR